MKRYVIFIHIPFELSRFDAFHHINPSGCSDRLKKGPLNQVTCMLHEHTSIICWTKEGTTRNNSFWVFIRIILYNFGWLSYNSFVTARTVDIGFQLWCRHVFNNKWCSSNVSHQQGRWRLVTCLSQVSKLDEIRLFRISGHVIYLINASWFKTPKVF